MKWCAHCFLCWAKTSHQGVMTTALTWCLEQGLGHSGPQLIFVAFKNSYRTQSVQHVRLRNVILDLQRCTRWREDLDILCMSTHLISFTFSLLLRLLFGYWILYIQAEKKRDDGECAGVMTQLYSNTDVEGHFLLTLLCGLYICSQLCQLILVHSCDRI